MDTRNYHHGARLGLQYFREKEPTFVCVVDPDGSEWTRDRFVASSNRLTRAFRSAGLVEGDVLAIASKNCAQYLIVYFAALNAGLSVVPINWHLSDSEIAYILRDSGAKVIVVHGELSPRAHESIRVNACTAALFLSIQSVAGYQNIETFAGEMSTAPLSEPARGRLLAYTSATTGRPKAVILPSKGPQELLRRRIEANALVGILPEDDNVNLCASMLYHSAPLGGCEVALTLGHRVVLVDIWKPELLLELIEKHRVTTTFLVPTMFVRLLKLEESIRNRYSVSSLRFVAHGGAPCPVSIKRAMLDWWGPIIWEAYGATEAQGTVVGPQDWLKYPGTVGKPLPGSAVKILDDAGEELPRNGVGTVYIKPNSGQTFQYKNDPARTQQCTAGEFVTVGDLGYLNEDGYLFICDRRDDLIVSAGVNIYPAEIEACLLEHPDVRDCAVIGESHALLGSVPKAYVEVEPGIECNAAFTMSLLRFAGERLAAMKIPKRIQYVASVPRDPSGKVFRRSLRHSEERLAT